MPNKIFCNVEGKIKIFSEHTEAEGIYEQQNYIIKNIKRSPFDRRKNNVRWRWDHHEIMYTTEIVKYVDKCRRNFSSFIKFSLAHSPVKGKQKCTVVRFLYNMSNVTMFL